MVIDAKTDRPDRPDRPDRQNRRVARDMRDCFAVMNGNPRPDDAAPTHWTSWSDLYEPVAAGPKTYLVLKSEPNKVLAVNTLAQLNELLRQVHATYTRAAGPCAVFALLVDGGLSRVNQLNGFDEAWCCAYCQANWIFINQLTSPRNSQYWNWRMYDLLHEVAHAISGQWQHNASFFVEWANLLRAATLAGVYSDAAMPTTPFPDDPGQYSAWNPYTDAGLAEALRLVRKHRGHPIVGF